MCIDRNKVNTHLDFYKFHVCNALISQSRKLQIPSPIPIDFLGHYHPTNNGHFWFLVGHKVLLIFSFFTIIKKNLPALFSIRIGIDNDSRIIEMVGYSRWYVYVSWCRRTISDHFHSLLLVLSVLSCTRWKQALSFRFYSQKSPISFAQLCGESRGSCTISKSEVATTRVC